MASNPNKHVLTPKEVARLETLPVLLGSDAASMSLTTITCLTQVWQDENTRVQPLSPPVSAAGRNAERRYIHRTLLQGK